MNDSNIKENKTKEQEKIGQLAWLFSNKYLFYIHTFIYAAVNGLLILIWAITTPLVSPIIGILFWPLYSILGWGIGYGFHAVTFLMYNDKIKALAKARRKGMFAILYVYHAWFYIIVNALIIYTTVSVGIYFVFLWPLSMWGILFVIHSIGFFTWDQRLNAEKNYFKSRLPETPDKEIEYKAGSKIIQLWLLIANIAYFITVLILLYTLPLYYGEEAATYINGEPINPIITMIPWMIFLGVHALSYYLFNYKLKIALVKSSFMVDLVAYVAFNIYFIIYQVVNPYNMFNTTLWIQYPLILWGIILVIHFVLIYRWNQELKNAMESLKKVIKEEIDESELKKRGFNLLFWKWSFIAHFCVYIGGIILIGINLASLGMLDTLIHPIMGWLIAVAIHFAIYVVYLKQIRAFLSFTAVIHTAIYATVSAYLILLNVLFSPGFPWSAIAIGGWAIGYGLHVLLAYLVQNRNK